METGPTVFGVTISKAISIVVIVAAIMLAATLGGTSVEAAKKSKVNVEVNFSCDSFSKAVVTLNDGIFGKKIAKKTFTIDPESDEANDLWEYVNFSFDPGKVKKSKLQVLVDVYENGDFVESQYDYQTFKKSKKSYDFSFFMIEDYCN